MRTGPNLRNLPHGSGSFEPEDWELSVLSVSSWEEEPSCPTLRKSLLKEGDVDRVATSLRCMDCAKRMELSGTEGGTGRFQLSRRPVDQGGLLGDLRFLYDLRISGPCSTGPM